jgi:YD repeat-containing protein
MENTWRNFTLPGTGIEVYPGPLVAVKDAAGGVTRFGYDQNTGELTSVTDAAGAITRTEYDANGFVTAEVDALGRRTEYVNDAQGRVLEERRTRTRADGSTELLLTSHTYDANGNLVATEHPDGSITTMAYDANDKLVAQCDGLARCTTTEYDARGNEVAITHPDGTVERKDYDANGNVISQTDRAGRLTRFVFDAANRLLETVHPDETPLDDSDNPRTTNECLRRGRTSGVEHGRKRQHDHLWI